MKDKRGRDDVCNIIKMKRGNKMCFWEMVMLTMQVDGGREVREEG